MINYGTDSLTGMLTMIVAAAASVRPGCGKHIGGKTHRANRVFAYFGHCSV